MKLSPEIRRDFAYLSLRSSLLEELSLLYGLDLSGSRERRARSQCCRRLMQRVLPELTAGPGQPEYPYLLGLLLERAGQLALTPARGKAYEQAAFWYDQARQLVREDRSRHYARHLYLRPSVALLRLFLRQGREEAFYDWWERCGGLRVFHRDVQALFQVRWLIVKEDYERARFTLRHLEGLAGRKSEFTPSRRRILEDIVSVASDGPQAPLQGSYSPYLRRALQRAARSDK